MSRITRYFSAFLSAPMLLNIVLANGNGIFVPRDTVVPVTFNDQLSISRNRVGDYFSATAGNDSRDLPSGTRLEGHVADIRPREGDRPAFMDLQFDDMILPDGTRQPLVAVPVPLNSRGVYRDQGGRLRADQRKIHEENIVIGGAVGGLLVGALIGKPFEGTFVGAIAGILGAEAARHDNSNNGDIVANRGTKVGVWFQQDATPDASYSGNYGNGNQYGYSNNGQSGYGRPSDNRPYPDQVGQHNPGYQRNSDGTYQRRYDDRTSRRNRRYGYYGPSDQNRPYYENDNRYGQDVISVDGRAYAFPVDQQPYRSGSSLMVPLRFVAEQNGYSVDVRNDRRIYLENDVNMIRLEQDSRSYRLNGNRGTLPANVEYRNGQAYVPIEVLAMISARPVYVNGTRLERTTYN
jgi:hypothetical protein